MSAHEPAFPFNELNDDGTHFLSRAGLTKREYFAGLAMQACIQVCRGDTIGLTETKEQMFARNSVRCADALIAALNAEPQA